MTKKAIAWAKRVYPDVTEITQLQLANAYMSGVIKGTEDAKTRALEIVDEGYCEPFPLFAEESERLQSLKEEKEYYADYSDREER